MRKRTSKLLSVLLTLAMVVGLLPTTAHAWETTGHCEFCGGFIADDWICDGGEHCSSDSDRSDCYQAHHCGECGKCVSDENELCSECGWCTDCGGECAAGIGSCGLCLKCHLEDWMACWECGMCFYEDEYMKCSECGRCYDCGGECSEGKDHACLECHYEQGAEWGANFVCEDCGLCFIEAPEYMCIAECGRCYDCGGECSEGKDHACLECHNEDGYRYGCEDCGLCFIENPDELCGGCGKCYECGGGECSEGKAHACLECHLAEGYEFACENCGQCYSPGDGSDIDEDMFCPECKICWDCVDECTNCGMCVYCAMEQGEHCVCEYCFEDYPQCPDCGLCSDCLDWCGNCERHTVCAAEDGDHCRNCLEVCGNENLCPECEVCEDCSSDWCSTCEMCLECHDSDDICMECEEVCLIDDGADCQHCSSCAEEYLCDGGCGQCLICADPDWCENCGTCIECAIADELHCPECENCYEEFAQCEAGNDHCVEHCVICKNCEECFYESESDICDECGLCLDCCEELKEAAGCTHADAPCVFNREDWKSHWNSVHADDHTHVYPDGYQKDEDGHWKTCIICDETESGDHEYGGWNYLTTREPYYGTHKCSVCNYSESCCHTERGNWQGIPCQTVDWTPTADETQHKYACEKCGNHVYHAHKLAADPEDSTIHVCEDCGLEQEHTYGEWTLKITQNPFIGRIYTSSSTCTGCGEKKTCTHLHGAIHDWTRVDDATHSFTCGDCGVTFKLPHQADSNGLHSDENGHWNTCGVCDDVIKVTPHVGRRVNKRTATATSDGYTGDLVCVLCDYPIEGGTEIPATGYDHAHAYSSEWTSGGGMHWHLCTTAGCSAKADIDSHDAGDWEVVTPATAETAGLKQRTCATCAFVDEAAIPAGHVHSHSRKWTSDATDHWHACACGDKADLAAHTSGNWIIDTPATKTTTGEKHKECTVCGYVMITGTIPVISYGGGGGSSTPTYPPTVEQPEEGGSIAVSPKAPGKGETVTITPKPEEGFTVETVTVTDENGKPVPVKENGDGTFSFTQPAGKVKIAVTFTETASESPFVDVPADAYYYDAVLWAAENGITGGVDDTHFAPNATCTRAQAVTFLWRAAGSPAPKSSDMPFTDVAAGSYYHDAVLWAMEQGITKGTSDTTFTPNAKCTRAQIVTFLWRAQKSPANGGENPFADVAEGTYYSDAVLWAVENGVTGGTTATTFSPANDCTRGQIVTFLFRCMK